MKFRVNVRVLKGTAAILAVVLVLLAGMLLLQRWENTQDAPVSSSGEVSSVEAGAPVDGWKRCSSWAWTNSRGKPQKGI